MKTEYQINDANLKDVIRQLARETNQSTSIDWHYVGEPGEPQFQGGWVNYGYPYQLCRFGNVLDGMIRLEGRAYGDIPGTVMYTLPAGYRPQYDLVFRAPMSVSGYVKVCINGDVMLISE